MVDYFGALGVWLFGICLLDFLIKGNYVSRFEREMETYNNSKTDPNAPWMSWEKDANPFFKDTGNIIKWRNCLLLLYIGVILLELNDKHYAFAFHFASMFSIEFVGYWLWAALLKRWVPQQQYFQDDNWTGYKRTIALPKDFDGSRDHIAVRRLPNFGEIPADPTWLPSWYRQLHLHKRWAVASIVLTNFLIALVAPYWS